MSATASRVLKSLLGFLAFSCVSCASSRASSPVTTVVPSVGTAQNESGLPRALTRPEHVVCVLENPSQMWDGMLALAPNGPSFALVNADQATRRIHVGAGSPAALFSDVHAAGVELHGYVSLTDAWIVGVRPVHFNEVASLQPNAILHVVAAQDDALTVAPNDSDDAPEVSPRARTDLHCDDVTIDAGPLRAAMAAQSSLPSRTRTWQEVVLRSDAAIPFSTAAGSPGIINWAPSVPVAARAHSPRARDFVEVHVERGLLQLDGWVPRSVVYLETLATAEREDRSEDYLMPEGEDSRCTQALPILARVGGEFYDVGSIEPGVLVVLGETAGPHRKLLSVVDDAIRVTADRDMSLFTTTRDAASCARATDELEAQYEL